MNLTISLLLKYNNKFNITCYLFQNRLLKDLLLKRKPQHVCIVDEILSILISLTKIICILSNNFLFKEYIFNILYEFPNPKFAFTDLTQEIVYNVPYEL